MTPAPISLRKLAVWTAAFIAPWSVIALTVAGCAYKPLRISDDPAPPPAAAIYWAVGMDMPSEGKDCNQFARENFARLTAQGKHPRYVAAITETGEGHMLVEAGGLAFDNRFARPVPMRMLPYRLVEASENGINWFRIFGGIS
jgi:hypothetical protein